jgi:anti-sigma factor RsiW
MKKCSWVQKRIIDRIEGELNDAEVVAFDMHIKECSLCKREYRDFRRLYESLRGEQVPLPADAFWERMQQRIRRHPIYLPVGRQWLRKLVPVAACVLTACVLVFMLVKRSPRSVEIDIPVSELLEDEDIAEIALRSMACDDLSKDIMIIEESMPFDIDEMVSEMTSEEQELFIELITKANNSRI